MVRPVGQEAHLTCPAEHAPGVSGTAEWEKVGGDLPYAYSIRNGELILKDLSRYDEGIYRCTIRAESGMATVTYINLQVSDFVPSFNGSGFVKLKPMTINEWEDVNIKLSVKPKMRDGLIFYTSRGKEGQDHADNFISVGLRRGKVVYRYDVGDGLEEIASTYPVRANEWHRIELKNNKDKAVLYVDSHDIVEKKNEGFAISEAPPTNISIGGMENLQSKPQAGFARGFDGVISELLVSGRPIDIGEEALASFGIVEQSTICSINPCQHGGLCVPANVHRGFACNCERTDGFEGEFCERRSRKCNGEKCAAGSCVLDESNGSHSCLCPYGRIGRLCEQIDRDAHQKPLNAIRFNGESSFLSLPPPSTLRNYTLELLVSPRTTQDQLLAYVASDYDPKHSNFMGLVMENGKFVYVYNNGDGDFEIEDTEQVKEGNAYRVELKRIGPKGEFGINDRKVASRRQQPSFQVGTDLFVGGLPPGVAPHRRLEQYSSLNGCIYKIIINGEEQDLKRFATVSSGGLSECEEELPPIPTTTTTTTTTTSLPVVTSTVAVMPEIEITPAALFTTPMEPVMTETTSECADGVCPEEAAVCKPDSCGEHGDCETVNDTHIACSCRDYYDGPNCEFFRPIEHAARFDGNAFIVFSEDEFPHLTSEKEETIEFRFKTDASSGLIFWQGQQPGTPLVGEDYLSIGLQDGHLVYSYELGGGAGQIISMEPVNDGKEHRVKAIRKGRQGTMIVDDSDVTEGHSSGILAMLNVDGDIYLGGVPDLESMTGALHESNFVGCIADIMLNGIKLDMMANAIDGRNVKPCEQWIVRRKWFRAFRKYR